MNNFGFKELYDVILKTTYPIEINDQKIEAGETIAAFDRIQLANFDERKDFVSANGGYDNRGHIWWEETKEVRVNLSQGVFSKEQFAIMSNAKLFENSTKSIILVNRRELVETNSEGKADVKFAIHRPVFIYKQSTGEKIENFSFEGNVIITEEKYQDCLVDYYYEYDNKYSVFTVGQSLTNGFLSLEGKTRVKDDITGQIVTGIIKIPKLKLLSNLSIRLGQDTVPVIGRMDAVAVPTGERGHKKVMELIFLSDDIDSDM